MMIHPLDSPQSPAGGVQGSMTDSGIFGSATAGTNSQSQLQSIAEEPVTSSGSRRRQNRAENYENRAAFFYDPHKMPTHSNRNNYENREITQPRTAYENWGLDMEKRHTPKDLYSNVQLQKGKERKDKEEKREEQEDYGLSIDEELARAGKLPWNPEDDAPSAGGGSISRSVSPSPRGHIYFQAAGTGGSEIPSGTAKGGQNKEPSAHEVRMNPKNNGTTDDVVADQPTLLEDIISRGYGSAVLLAPAMFMRSSVK